MNVFRSGRLGLVLDNDGRVLKMSAYPGAPLSLGYNSGSSGHFIVNRYTVDFDGNVALTPTLPIRELYTSVALFKAELDSLLDQAAQRISTRRCIDRRSRNVGP